MSKINICGIAMDNLYLSEAVSRIDAEVLASSPKFVVTPNVDHIVQLQSDFDFKNIYNNARLVLADGMPIIWASHFLGTPLKERVTGADLAPELCALAHRKGYQLFFLGGRPDAARQAKERIEKRYPGIKPIAIYSPPFGFEQDEEENKKILKMIKESKPDILLVGLGAPKQEKWIYRNYKELGVPVSVGVGVTFEFMAGIVKRAPKWMQNAGLEWFWRLLMEPSRLWKRYLIKDMPFFWLVLKQKFRRNSFSTE